MIPDIQSRQRLIPSARSQYSSMATTQTASLRSCKTRRHATFCSSKSNLRERFGESEESVTTAPTSMTGSPCSSAKYAFKDQTPSPITPNSNQTCAVRLHRSELPRFREVQYYVEEPVKDRLAVQIHDAYYEPDEYDDDMDFFLDIPEVFPISRPTVPQDFADYFPSQRRLLIQHDGSTHDGNMNLKIVTEEMEDGRKVQVQLFHLRMKDLESRTFSLRRYCRDSGREVCNSVRRYQTPAAERPSFQRSVSNALASLRPELKRLHSEKSSSIKSAPTCEDSGYGSDRGEEFDDAASIASTDSVSEALEPPTKSIKLEFSNYAQVDVKRCGSKSFKHYDFEYWGCLYSWKRTVEKVEDGKSISFDLIKSGSQKPIAHIAPIYQNTDQIRAEARINGWVPPCSLWISDAASLTAFTDVADVIVSTGLIALVDDAIKRHFFPKDRKTQFTLPLTTKKVEFEFGTKALVEHMFRRKNSAATMHEREHAQRLSR